jgi:hypothetical protein
MRRGAYSDPPFSVSWSFGVTGPSDESFQPKLHLDFFGTLSRTVDSGRLGSAFSLSLTSEEVSTGVCVVEFGAENATRFCQTSLISFSSNSRASGMIVSKSSVQTTITRSSRYMAVRTSYGVPSVEKLTMNAPHCSLSALGSILIESTIWIFVF